MVEGAALEMLCGETHPGFESLTLRHKNPVIYDGILFLIQKKEVSLWIQAIVARMRAAEVRAFVTMNLFS